MDDRPRSRSRSQDPRFAQAVGRTIKVFRTDQGLRRRELAEEVGISYSYLTEIENGNKPPSHTVLSAIAAALGVQLHELIADAEQRVGPDETQAHLFSSPAPREAELHGAPVSPSARRQRTLVGWRRGGGDGTSDELRPTYPTRRYDQGRSTLSGALWELQDLLPKLDPEDLERVMDLVRRLAR